MEKTERGTSAATRELDETLSGLLVAGTYRLLERLGTGGMADVYEAEHLRLGNRVAVKLLRMNGRADRPGVDRFRHEARRVAALSSDHIVKVFDCGELPNGTPYLVMERLWGEDLRSLLERKGRLPVRRAVGLAISACHGLSVVHAAGLVHRDLKPANLFVVRGAGGADSCKILDFGVAKALVSDATAGGALLGTVRYMAPEQLEDAASARATADIYALGAILYECLTGAPPHPGEKLQELMFNILHRDVVPPGQLCALPKELEALVQKALARDKSQRFPDADELAAALAPFGAVASASPGIEGVDDATLAEEPEPVSSRPKPPSARGRALALLAALGLTLAGIAALRNGTPPSPKPAAATLPPAAALPTPMAAPPPTLAPSTSSSPPEAATASMKTPEGQPPPLRDASTTTAKTTLPIHSVKASTSRPTSASPPPSAVPSPNGRFDSNDPYAN